MNTKATHRAMSVKLLLKTTRIVAAAVCMANLRADEASVGSVVFTSGENGDIIIVMDHDWTREYVALPVSVRYFDYETRQSTLIASCAWTVEPAGGTVAAGEFTATARGVYTLAAQYNGSTQTATVLVLPAGTDSDGDGMPDDWEIAHGLDPNDQSDADKDLDGDGKSNREECAANTPPDVASYDAEGTGTGEGGVIINPDRLTNYPVIGWCGTSRQVVQAFTKHRDSGSIPMAEEGPSETVPYLLPCYVGDRVFISSVPTGLHVPMYAGHTTVTIKKQDQLAADCYSYEGYWGFCPPHSVTGGVTEAETFPLALPRISDMPLDAQIEITYRGIEGLLTDRTTLWYYRNTTPHFLHFTYSLYRVEFADQETGLDYSKDNVFAPISDTPVVIKGRLLYAPDVPDTQLCFLWRTNGVDWMDKDHGLTVYSTDQPHNGTHLPGVAYKYFSVTLPAGIFVTCEFEAFFDINGDGAFEDLGVARRNALSGSQPLEQQPASVNQQEERVPNRVGPFSLDSDMNNDGKIDGTDCQLKINANADSATDDQIAFGTEYLMVNDNISNGQWDKDDADTPRSYVDDDDVQELQICCPVRVGIVKFEYPKIDDLQFYSSRKCDYFSKVTFPLSLSYDKPMPKTLYVRALSKLETQSEGFLQMTLCKPNSGDVWATDKLRLTVVKGVGDAKFFHATRDYILENNTRYWAGMSVGRVRIVVMLQKQATMTAVEAYWRTPKLWQIDGVINAYQNATVAINGNFTFNVVNIAPNQDISTKCHGRLVSLNQKNASVSSDNTTSPGGSWRAGPSAYYFSMPRDYEYEIAQGQVPDTVATIPKEALGGYDKNYEREEPDTMVGIANAGKDDKGDDIKMVFVVVTTEDKDGLSPEFVKELHKNTGKWDLIRGDGGASRALAYRDPSNAMKVFVRGARHRWLVRFTYCINTYIVFTSKPPRDK